MPFKSEKQRKLMYAAAQGKVKDIAPAVAGKYIADSTSPRRKLAAKRKAKSK
jgi:hypothetical protein